MKNNDIIRQQKINTILNKLNQEENIKINKKTSNNSTIKNYSAVVNSINSDGTINIIRDGSKTIIHDLPNRTGTDLVVGQSVYITKLNGSLNNSYVSTVCGKSPNKLGYNGAILDTDGFTCVSADGNKKTVVNSDNVSITYAKDSNGVWQQIGGLTPDNKYLATDIDKDGFINGFSKTDDNSLSATKIDKESIVQQINGANTTILGSKVLVNNTTLDTAFTNITGDINSISIGGTNLLRNTNFYKAISKSNTNTNWSISGSSYVTSAIETIDNKNWMHMTCTDTTSSFRGLYQIVDGFEPNTDYTISFKAYAANDGTNINISGSGMYILIHQKNSSGNLNPQLASSPFVLDMVKKTYSYTFTSTNDTTKNGFNIMIYGINKAAFDVYITDIKFEKGNKATDWSPSPDDVHADITRNTSEIVQTANAIGYNISSDSWNSDGKISTMETNISANATAITSKVEKDGVISSINQTAEEITINADKINLEGLVNALNVSTMNLYANRINNTEGYYATFELDPTNTYYCLSLVAPDNTTKAYLGMYNVEDDLYAGMSITAKDQMYLMVGSDSCVLMLDDVNNGTMSLQTGTINLAATSLINCTAHLGLATANYPQIYGNGTVLQMSYGNNSDGVVLTSTEFRPAGSGYPLGSATHRWGQIYSTNSVISTSDRNLKNSIVTIPTDKATNFIMALNPVTYKFNDGTGKRTHWGMIAQETETALTNLNMTTLDFAGVCYDKLEDGTYRYGLRYEEFIAPIIAVEQDHEKRIEALEQQMATLINK